MALSDHAHWQQIRENAASTRFYWEDSLRDYVEKLYAV
jgi:hypothetical protein